MRTLILIAATAMFLSSCSGRGGVHQPVTKGDGKYHATHFMIENFEGLTRLTVTNPFQNETVTEFEYYLLPSESAMPDSLKGRRVIRVPVRRIVCMSVTHLAMVSALCGTSAVAGVSGTGLVYDPDIRELSASGRIAEVGYEAGLDNELIISLAPDLIIAYGVSPASADYLSKVEEAGITILYDADYLEQHPLARAEWLKVFGELLCKRREADSLWGAVYDRYTELADSVASGSPGKPSVLLGYPWEDVWYIPPAGSYIATLISDAGGHYLFDDERSDWAIPYSVEAVFQRAAEADIWINPGTSASLAGIEADDRRMTLLPVYRSGNVWNNTARITPGGGNDYWESAVIRPDILLQDLISIIHREKGNSREPVYFRKLE